MKKFGMLLMCLSLGLFTVGCQPSEETTTPVGGSDATAPADTTNGEGGVVEPDTTTEPATTDTPAE